MHGIGAWVVHGIGAWVVHNKSVCYLDGGGVESEHWGLANDITIHHPDPTPNAQVISLLIPKIKPLNQKMCYLPSIIIEPEPYLKSNMNLKKGCS